MHSKGGEPNDGKQHSQIHKNLILQKGGGKGMRRLDEAEPEYLTVGEVAKRYRLSSAKAYELAHSLEHTLTFGRAIRVFAPDLASIEKRDEMKGGENG